MSEHHLLVIDDDVRLTHLVGDYFRREGFSVDVVNHGGEAVDTALRLQPDVILLDVMLPGEDGLSICRRLRAEGFANPVLMLTARGDEIDQVVGLELGADDYVPKPASPRLLLARIRALLRRNAPTPEPEPAAGLVAGPLSADQSTRQATLDGAPLTLTTAEFDLLWVLLEHVGRPVSREDLIRELRGIRYDGLDRSIDVRVSQLRRKLHTHPDIRIKTIRGVGYQLVSLQ
jgi:two-component system response regulator RstA